MRGGGVMRVVPRGAAFNANAVSANSALYGQPSLRAVNGPSGGGAIGTYTLQPGGGIAAPTIRVFRPRAIGWPIGAQPAGVPYRSVPPLSKPNASYNEHAFQINRELENYRNNVVTGSSVQHFNEIIDQLLQELSRAADDRAKLLGSHREYIDHMQLTHAAALEIKDNRIRELEHSMVQMKEMMMTTFKKEQLQLVKNNASGGGGASSNSNTGAQQIQDGDHQMKTEVQHNNISSASGAVGGSDSNGAPMMMEGATAPLHMQCLRPAGMPIRPGGAPPMYARVAIARQQHASAAGGPNGAASSSAYDPSFFEDEEEDMDDEEDFEDYDEGESADIDSELGAQVTI